MLHFQSVSHSVELDCSFGREPLVHGDLPGHPEDDDFGHSFLGYVDQTLLRSIVVFFLLISWLLLVLSVFEGVPRFFEPFGEDSHDQIVVGGFHGGDDDESIAKLVEKIADFDGFLELLVGEGHFGSVGDGQTIKIGVK